MSAKRFSKILNLPVINIQEGAMLGNVRSFLLDPQATRVMTCEVKEPSPQETSLHLPYGDINVIGPDAVIVSGKPEKGDLPPGAGEGINLVGKRALSQGGRLIGTVRDFAFLEDGTLTNIFLTAGMSDLLRGEAPLPAAAILNLGRDFVVIRDEAAEKLPADTFAQIRDRGREISHSLEIRAIEFSLNKPVNKSIYGPGGLLIITRGQPVTPEIIDTAREQGRLPQVLVAAGVGELLEALDVPREKLDAGSRKLLEVWERIKGTGKGQEPNENPETPPPGESGEGKNKPPEEEGEVEEFLDELQSFSRSTARRIEKTSYSAMRRYLKGKYASKQVVEPGGQILVYGDQLIDEDVIARAEELGLLSHLFIGVFKEDAQYRLGHIRDMFTDFFEGNS